MPYGLFDYVPDSGIHTMGVQTCADCPEGYEAVCQPPRTVSPAPAPVPVPQPIQPQPPTAVPPSLMPRPSCPPTAIMPNMSAQINRQVGAVAGDFLELVRNPNECVFIGGCVNIDGCYYKALPRLVEPPTMRPPEPPRQSPAPVLPPWMPIGPRPPTITPPPNPPSSGGCPAGQVRMSDGSCKYRVCPAIALPPCPSGQSRTGDCGLGPCTGPITPVPAPQPTPPAIRPPVIRPPINTGPITGEFPIGFHPSPYPSPNNPYADRPEPAPAPAPIVRPQPVPISSGQGVGTLIGGQRPPDYGTGALANPKTDPFANMRDHYGNLPEAYLPRTPDGGYIANKR